MIHALSVNRHPIVISDFAGPEPTAEELETRKRITDRAHLLDHVDDLLRPPPWVYQEIEVAMEHAIKDELDATISSRDGRDYQVSDLVDRWELDRLMDLYAREPNDPRYEPAGRPWDGNESPTTDANSGDRI